MKKENSSKQNAPKGKFIFSLFTFGFFALIGIVAAVGLIMPDRAFSSNENRVLASAPVLTAESLFDGSFMKKTETYLTDQFPFRDGAIYVKSLVERVLGKKEENGAYIGKNGYLFDKPSLYDVKKMAELQSAINNFAEKHSDIGTCFALVPNSSFVYSEYLDENLSFQSQKKQISYFYSGLDNGINYVDTVTPLLKYAKDYQLFYKTDHHWTTRGAFAVFSLLAQTLEIDAKLSDYSFYTVSDSFEGTLKSKVNSASSSDVIEICIPEKTTESFVIDFYGAREKSATFFCKEKLDEKNQYEVFLGGNYAKLTITTDVDTERKLVVIKDSYANCLLPMLTPYFSKITVLDPRYMSESVESAMSEDSYTDIVYLYNVNTFLQDTSLKNVL